MWRSLVRFMILLALSAISPVAGWTQKPKEVKETGSYKMRIEKSMSEAEAERICIERAKIDAIEKAFGQTVFQGNATYIRNENTGQKTESQNVFNMVSESLVNGEWIEDLKKPEIEKLIENEEVWIQATVVGRIREVVAIPVTFKAVPVSCPNITCEQMTFKDGQDFYLYFKAPQNGYISVYMDVPDENRTYRILPYKNSAGSLPNYKVEADKEYVFFSPQNNRAEDVDEIVLAVSAKNRAEINKLFVLYSPNAPFGKPLLSAAQTSHAVADKGLETPLYLESEAFQRWLQQTRRNGSDVQLYITSITINP